MSIKHEEGEVAMEKGYEQTDKGKTNTRAHKTEEEKGGGAEPEVVWVMAIFIQTGAGEKRKEKKKTTEEEEEEQAASGRVR